MNCPHCNVHIDVHEAGRETDMCVAVVVFAKSEHHYDCPHFDKNGRMLSFCSCPNLPRYSTDISAAWEVVERLTTMGWMVFVAERLKGDNYCRLEWEDPFDPKWESIMVRNASIPLAICRAAIKACAEDE